MWTGAITKDYGTHFACSWPMFNPWHHIQVSLLETSGVTPDYIARSKPRATSEFHPTSKDKKISREQNIKAQS